MILMYIKDIYIMKTILYKGAVYFIKNININHINVQLIFYNKIKRKHFR